MQIHEILGVAISPHGRTNGNSVTTEIEYEIAPTLRLAAELNRSKDIELDRRSRERFSELCLTYDVCAA